LTSEAARDWHGNDLQLSNGVLRAFAITYIAKNLLFTENCQVEDPIRRTGALHRFTVAFHCQAASYLCLKHNHQVFIKKPVRGRSTFRLL
jgi:hypothetical protein